MPTGQSRTVSAPFPQYADWLHDTAVGQNGPYRALFSVVCLTMSMLTVGVIAVQGDVAEHAEAIERAAERHGEVCRIETIRSSGTVPDCDLLLLPGGESTTISRLLAEDGLDEEIEAFAAAGKPVLATCAGLIVASSDAKDDRVGTLDLLDVSVDRNAFGRQKDSFEAVLDVTGLADPFPAVFIRAPTIDSVGDDVQALASVDGRPVAVRQGNVLGTSFHPELTDDSRIHGLAFFE
jgi:pyridoxal phosphate synthase yaaE subunit